MSTPAKLFGIYFGIGLLMMILGLISGKARRPLKSADPFLDGGPIDAGILIFIALLWPIWLLATLTGKNDRSDR